MTPEYSAQARRKRVLYGFSSAYFADRLTDKRSDDRQIDPRTRARRECDAWLPEGHRT
jgi:hypothetical protein